MGNIIRNIAGSSQFPLPHQGAVEAALGVSLPPEFIGTAELEDPDRTDIYVKAHAITLDGIRALTGKCMTDDPDGRQKLASPSALTAQERTAIAGMDIVQYLRRQVAIANNVNYQVRSLLVPEGADVDTPRSRSQAHITNELRKHLLTLPSHWLFSENIDDYTDLQDGMAVISSTGSGKTVVEAGLIRLAGVGLRQGLGDALEERCRAMLITSSRKLVNQFAGMTKDQTFKDFLGKDITMTRFFSDHKDDTGDVVVTTPESARKLRSRDYDLTVIDEGHRGMGPKTIKHLGGLGSRSFFLTATPQYNDKRDLRNLYKYIEVGSLRGDIEQGILNPTRILSFTFDDNPEALAAQLAFTYLQTGRKVVVYCQSGTRAEPSLQSRTVAHWINDLAGERVASSVGTHNKKSDEDEEAFSQDRLNVLTTRNRLREGWNENVDVGIFIGPNGSLLDLTQKCGRIVRPGAFVSELVELVPARRKKELVSLWQVMGLENVETDLVIGPSKRGQAGSDTDFLHSNGVLRSQVPQEYVPVEVFPTELRDRLVSDKPVRSITIYEAGLLTKAPEGHVNVADLAEKHNIPVLWLQRKLDDAGFAYEGVWKIHGKERDFDRWYEPGITQYLAENPIPALVKDTEMAASEIAKLCGITGLHVVRIAEEYGLIPQPRLNSRNREFKYYDFESIRKIIEVAESIPVADKTDVPMTDLTKEIPTAFLGKYRIDMVEDMKPEDGILPVEKRRYEGGVRSISLHVSLAEATRVREAYAAASVVATDEDIGYTEMAHIAGVTLATVLSNLTEEELSSCYPRRKRPGSRPADYLPRAMGLAVVERVKTDKLPVHMIPLPAIAQYIGRDKSLLAHWLSSNGYPPTKLRVSVLPSNCYSWKGLQELEEAYGRHPDSEPIEYERLIHDERDLDPDRQLYSVHVQARYVKEHALSEPKLFSDEAHRAVRAVIEPREPALPKAEVVPKKVTPEVPPASAPPESAPDPAETLPIPPPEPEPVIEPEPEPAPVSYEKIEFDLEDEDEGPPAPPAPLGPQQLQALIAASKASKPSDSSSEQRPLTKVRGPTASIASIPITPVNRPQRQPASPKAPEQSLSKSEPVVPANYVNLPEYLTQQDAVCDPRLIIMLARRNRVNDQIIRKQQGAEVWASEDAAIILEEAIKAFPVAKPTMYTSQTIIDHTGIDWLTPEQIAHLAGQLVSSTEGHVAHCRIYNPGGAPGELTLHYQESFAKRIMSTLEMLRARGRLAVVKRMGTI